MPLKLDCPFEGGFEAFERYREGEILFCIAGKNAEVQNLSFTQHIGGGAGECQRDNAASRHTGAEPRWLSRWAIINTERDT
ncbi:hypothetical protein V9K92_07225 [Phyllobacterium sp. CCNWLW109]